MQGILIIVSGHSGAGKSTIVELAIKKGAGRRIITCTTRAPREKEVDGKDYRFFSKKEFVKKLEKGEFAEHAEVYGNFYGTLATDIDAARRNASVAFLIVDVRGAKTLLRKYPDARGVFVSIPRNELERRLMKRGDMPEDIERRMSRVVAETTKKELFEVIIRNKTGELALSLRDFLSFVKKCCVENAPAEEKVLRAKN